MMSIEIQTLTGVAIGEYLEQLSALRMAIFREWPYLYDDSPAQELRYIARYVRNEGAVLVAAFNDEGELVGAATGQPLIHELDAFQTQLQCTGRAPELTFAIGEILLHKNYRGQGVGHRFLDEMEQHARELGYGSTSFWTVERPSDHLLRPADCRSLDGFWQKRGYVPCPSATLTFHWKDIGEAEESAKLIQMWIRDLDPLPVQTIIRAC